MIAMFHVKHWKENGGDVSRETLRKRVVYMAILEKH